LATGIGKGLGPVIDDRSKSTPPPGAVLTSMRTGCVGHCVSAETGIANEPSIAP